MGSWSFVLLTEGLPRTKRGGEVAAKEVDSAGEVGPVSFPAGPASRRQPAKDTLDLLPKLGDLS